MTDAKDDKGGKDVKATVEKARSLMRLAADNENPNEARNAAVKLVTLMKEEDLVLMPRSEAEAMSKVVGEARQLAETVKKEQVTNMLIGGLVGFVVGGGKVPGLK